MSETLILDRPTIAALMVPRDYLAAVETGFLCYAQGRAEAPAPMHIAGTGGGFHAKGARVLLDRAYVALKLNANFPGNPRDHALPTIQGVIVLCDGSDGSVLALMDSIEVTLRRTAAASALAARRLARKDADCIAVCGCGAQGRAQLAALAEVLAVRRAFAWDIDRHAALQFSREMSAALRVDVTPVEEAHEATLQSGVIVTATPARAPFLTRDMVAEGAFIAAVGADSPEKSELAGDLMSAATIVVDLVAQAAAMGDLHHAIDAGLLTAADVYAEMGELLVGSKPGRTSEDQIIVFDSTGTAIQDAASAVWIWRRAVADNAGSRFTFAAH
jgi:ornithine cyclodeaminase/alanine dehydrogenase-like protein (mu-crystallin family)